MGRPAMSEGKRTKKIGARFTEMEYELILALKKQLGLSETDLVRERLLNDNAKSVINAKEFLFGLDHIGAEIGRVGNNINQLARHANTLKLAGALHPSVILKFNELFEQYLGTQQALETALRKIILAMAR